MDAATAGFLIGLGSLALVLIAVVIAQKVMGVTPPATECPAQETYFFLCPHDGIH